MARYFLSYSKSYDHIRVVIKEVMESLGLNDVVICNQPDAKRPSEFVQEAINSCDGVVILYGPQAKPLKNTKKLEGAEWPRDEANYTQGRGIPFKLIVHEGTRLSAALEGCQSFAHFDFWNPNSFQKNIHNIIKHLLDLKKEVEIPISPASFQNSGEPVSDTISRGFLHLNSTLFHEVDGEVKEIINDSKRLIIPTKYLFAHAKSYDLYNVLAAEDGYTIAKDGSGLFFTKSRDIAEYLSDRVTTNHRLTIVSLGVGVGKKEAHLLRELYHLNVAVSLLAIDINPAFIKASSLRIKTSLSSLRQSPQSIRPNCQFLIGDFDNIDHLSALLPNDEPVLFLALSGIFGNQNESEFLENIRRSSKGQVYLLFDFQTKRSIEIGDKGGYESRANKDFISSIIEVLCGEQVKPEDVRALHHNGHDKRIPELGNHQISRVPKSETIVMVGETKSGQKRYAGYSTRYDKRVLSNFLTSKDWETEKRFEDKRHQYTALYLCKADPYEK